MLMRYKMKNISKIYFILWDALSIANIIAIMRLRDVNEFWISDGYFLDT